MALGSLDFSNTNFNFGSTDFGLGNFSLPATFSVFTPEQAQALQQNFAASSASAASTKTTSVTTKSSTTRQNTIPTPPAGIPPPVRPPLPKPDDLTGTKTIGVNPNRYRVFDTQWQVSASPDVPKLEFTKGTRPTNLIPVLRANGIVVKAFINGVDMYLISPQTLADMQKSGNPHYDIADNGTLLKTTLGKTIPIIQLNMNLITELIKQRDLTNTNAGVKDVVYISETTEEIFDVPAGLLDQINFTLDTLSQRPADTFQIWDLGLTADYNITNFVIVNKQADGKLDAKKMKEFLSGIKARQKAYQDDLNRIKLLFYEGRPPGTTTFKTITQVATGNPLDRSAGGSTYIIKGSELVNTEKPAAEVAKDAATAATDALANPTIDLSWTKDLRKVNATWAAYGFTTAEADSLKRPQNAGTLFITPKGVPNAINIAINWNPSVCTKARIVANIPEQRPADTARNPIAQQLIAFFGKLNPMESDADWKQYITVNNNKKAELLHIARLIRDEERTNSMAQATGGGAGVGGPGDRQSSERPASQNNQSLNEQVAGDRGRARFE